jgi:hypothetical protein
MSNPLRIATGVGKKERVCPLRRTVRPFPQ